MGMEQKADRISWLGIAFVAGWISCNIYYQIPKLWHAEALVPQLADVAGCQTQRARVAENLLLNTPNGSIYADQIPSCPQPPKIAMPKK